MCYCKQYFTDYVGHFTTNQNNFKGIQIQGLSANDALFF